MPDNQNRLVDLLEKYSSNTITETEFLEFCEIVKQPENENILKENVEIGLYHSTFLSIDKGQLDKMLGEVLRQVQDDRSRKTERLVTPVRRMAKRWQWAAACIVILLGMGAYLLLYNKAAKPDKIVKTEEERFKNDVDPGKYKAKLTLSDGREIVLDSANFGELAKQGNTVVMNKDGQLVYSRVASAPSRNDEVMYNTLSTARGETYISVLPDGTKVWLNSASAIKFPVAFTGNERKVEIIGEAYFEVAHNAVTPFIVKDVSRATAVQVLGTHFNVNTYPDETVMKVTLLEGSVKVSKGASTSLLKPGQQAQVTNEVKVVNGVNLDEVMAWKNGAFYFNGTDIKAVMKQVERWYDVEVNYEAPIVERFGGSIPRDVTISKLLKMLELTDHVHFKVEGKKITVMR